MVTCQTRPHGFIVVRELQLSEISVQEGRLTHFRFGTNDTTLGFLGFKHVFTIKGNIYHTGHRHNSRVVTTVEFGEEVGGTSFLALTEVAHYVSPLFPDVDRFL